MEGVVEKQSYQASKVLNKKFQSFEVRQKLKVTSPIIIIHQRIVISPQPNVLSSRDQSVNISLYSRRKNKAHYLSWYNRGGPTKFNPISQGVQNFRPLSQKFSEISRFEKFEFMRFCLTLTC